MSDHPRPARGVHDGADWRRLHPARQRAGLSMTQLYLRYVALGGSAPVAELASHFAAGTELTSNEHNFAVLALNERFLELDDPERLSYVG